MKTPQGDSDAEREPQVALRGQLGGETREIVVPDVKRFQMVELPDAPVQLVEQIAEIFANYAFETEIIVASIRNPLHVLDSALAGADIATIPFSVLSKLAAHPLTDKGIQAFMADWEKTKS